MSTKMTKPYTDADLGYIADTLGRPREEVAAHLGRKPAGVTRMRRILREGGAPKGRQWWTPAEEELLRELAPHKTAEQLTAIFPGRSLWSIQSRRSKILKLKVGQATRLNPYHVGRRTVIAKTCSQCGLLLPGTWFAWNEKAGAGRKRSACRECQAKYKKTVDRSPAKERTKQTTLAWQKKMQEATLSGATRTRMEYTSADHEILADPGMTILGKALALHRTWKAVSDQCSLNGYKSGRWLGAAAHDVWLIDNPNADFTEWIRAAQESELAASGRPLPMWDDLEVAS